MNEWQNLIVPNWFLQSNSFIIILINLPFASGIVTSDNNKLQSSVLGVLSILEDFFSLYP